MAQKKYIAVVKVGTADFIKLHLNNANTFCKHLDDSYPNWRYFNVFDKKTREQVGGYTKYDRPRFTKDFENGELNRK